MTSSEDVLLQVGPVRHKKGDGTLYVMSQHVAFILNSSDTVAISHHYRDIKMQKISSEFKNKVQLQLVFHDETISLFQFTNPERYCFQIICFINYFYFKSNKIRIGNQ